MPHILLAGGLPSDPCTGISFTSAGESLQSMREGVKNEFSAFYGKKAIETFK
jgi:hypothetical protein